MTVYTYSTYQAPAEEAPVQPVGVRIDADAGRTTSVVIRNGVMTQEQSSAQRVTSSELNPHYGDGSVFATARNPRGSAVTKITPETMLTIAEVQAPASFFEEQGFIHRGADGRYAEGSGQPQEAAQEALPADNPDALHMPDEVIAGVNEALEVVSDQHRDPLVATAIAVATGQLDQAELQRKFVSVAGVTPEEAAARVSFVQAAYQQQAESAVTHRCGIAAGDLPALWAWAKESQPGALRDAVNKQVHHSDLSGYRALADRWQRENPPSLEAVKAAGLETRQMGDKPEVFLDGRWLPIATAARIGMI